MRGTILQPGYFPWLGFFNQMALSDVFVYLDDVQFDRRGWRNRNRIKSVQGPVWLTVPVVQKGKFEQNLHETEIDSSQNWAKKHLKTIEFNYRVAPHFSDYYSSINDILSMPWQNLVELDISLIDAHKKWLGLQSVITLRASRLRVDDTDKTGRLVEICRRIGIDEYISGPLCRDYLDIGKFLEAGIRVFLHKYSHPVYPQQHGDFLPFMAAIDLLMNAGDASLGILRQQKALVDFQQYDSADGVPDFLK